MLPMKYSFRLIFLPRLILNFHCLLGQGSETRVIRNQHRFKVARLNVFIGTPSIFESLILKQIDLYCKTIMTYGLHLALNQISALFGTLFWIALRCKFFWLMRSAVRSFTKIYKRSFRDILKFLLKKGINYACREHWTQCKQICHFLDVSEKVLALIRFSNDPLNASTLARFQNAWKSMNQGKTLCWALFVTSKANLRKTEIKTKFVHKFF